MKIVKKKRIPIIFSVFSSTEQSTDMLDTAEMRVFICRTDGIQCDGGISYLSDNDRVRYRCRHQVSPATQKVSATVTAERNSDVSPLVTNQMYRDFTVLHCMTHKDN
jgi:hypothetical protein